MAILAFEDFSWCRSGESPNTGTLPYSSATQTYSNYYYHAGGLAQRKYVYPAKAVVSREANGRAVVTLGGGRRSGGPSGDYGRSWLAMGPGPSWSHVVWRVPGSYKTDIPAGVGVANEGTSTRALIVARDSRGFFRLAEAYQASKNAKTTYASATQWRPLPDEVWSPENDNTIMLRVDRTFSTPRYYFGVNGIWFPEYLSTGEALDRVGIGAFSPTDSDAAVYEMIVADSEIADCRVISTFPGADVSGQFAPSEGVDGFAMLNDETPDGDATIVESNTDGDEGIYDYRTRQDLAPTLDEDEEILAMRFDTQARNETIDPRAIEYLVEDSTGKQVVATKELAQSYALNPAFFNTNPNTGLPWDKAEVLSANFGFRLVASTGS